MNTFEDSGSRRKVTCRFLLGIAVALFSLGAGRAQIMQGGGSQKAEDAKEQGAGLCTSTALAAARACRHDAEDNYWITIGNCRNLSDPDARKACQIEARAARKEALDECGAQLEARFGVCGLLGEAPYDPTIAPSMFVDPTQIGKSVQPNPYFPLVAGTAFVFRSESEIDTVTITHETRDILGVTCLTVHDVVQDKDSGEVTEDTKDWYAQDVQGNVWYFGEIAQQFEGGELVGIEGSWLAGVEFAKAGIIMEAKPAAGDVYRQEFSLGTAEDMGQVLSVKASASTPGASCDGTCVLTKDFSALEPDVVEHKYYAPGVGVILELDPATGERLELVQIKR